MLGAWGDFTVKKAALLRPLWIFLILALSFDHQTWLDPSGQRIGVSEKIVSPFSGYIFPKFQTHPDTQISDRVHSTLFNLSPFWAGFPQR